MDHDLYAVLGISRDADQDSIKKAYRKLAMQFHPDKNPGDSAAEEKFKEAAKAYEILGNKEKRARYDRFGMAGVEGFGGAGGGFHDVSDVFEAFGDIFGDFFGGGRRPQRRDRTRPSRGSDLRYRLSIDLKDVLSGTQKEIEFDAEVDCGVCNGTGAKVGSHPRACTTCGGRGQVIRSQGFFQMATTCPTCAGEGMVIADPCEECEGAGRLPTRRHLAVNVPAGVDTGTQLRLGGEGEAGRRGGPAGDLYVEIHVQAHATFVRREQNLLAPLKISYLQAILGAEVEVETLSKTQSVEVPSGVQHGEWLKVTGEGVPSLRGGRSGDLLLEVQIQIPKKLSKDEEARLREIANLKGESVFQKKGFFHR